MIERSEYLARLQAAQDKKIIKVITGVRRCGKSYLLKQYQEKLVLSGIKTENIVSIDLDLLEFEQLREKHALHEYCLARLNKSGMTYVFIDEAQRCEGFEDAVESLFARGMVDLYLTGSNATMLSGELATLLSGRFIEVKMLPLSFKEYCSFLEKETTAEYTKDQAFRDYTRWGAFPEIINLKRDVTLIDQYLEGIYNTVLVNDVAERHAIRDISALKKIAGYLFAHTGSIMSGRKISGAITSAGHKVSQPTVENYLNYLIDGRLFYQADRFDIASKEHLKQLAKYYAVDTGLRNHVLGFRGGSRGHLLENVVYLELVRRGYRVWVGKVGEAEVDFVAENHEGLLYIQVAESVNDPAVLERELAPLRKIGDFRTRLLLSQDYDLTPDYDGIRHFNVIEWLLA